MKRIHCMLAGMTFAAAFALTGATDAGTVHYSWNASASSASVGDTVTLTLHADIDPEGAAYFGLATANFDIMADDIPLGGAVNNAAPLGLMGPWAIGTSGVVVGDDILGVAAAQMPPFLGGNTSTSVDLYTFEYTVMDGTARDVDFSLNPQTLISVVFEDNVGSQQMPYTSSADVFTLNIAPVPGPGPLALLGAAGLIGLRRRRSA